ncbi:MAG: branched-chain amino acid aminotransferase [Rhodobiaceae bacterium]|nr:branched-chain amino acid aminotransferase [Rhodobiaceae bacterium]MCC0042232.1 branched-chain amino acid aminotransferase [Rhodobiaceae bacterium]
MAELSKTWTWIEGKWLEGNPGIVGPRTHGLWLGSCVFDGARAFEGVTPDLDRHCARVQNSAGALGLNAIMQTGEILELVQEGLAKFDGATPLYIKPMYWAEEGGYVSVPPLAESTRFCLTMYEAPMPEPTGFSVTKCSFRRPTIETAPVNAKAACLYPNSGRALREVQAKGFDNAVVLDSLANVAELATANLFMAKDGEVHTPVPNGTFLNGITRQRVIALLRADGHTVHERAITYEELRQADELFSTGNYLKVSPINRIDERDLQPGPVYARARQLYWDWAHS